MSRMRSAALKPPLPKSPIRLRSRRVLRSNSTSLQTPPPPGSLKKFAKPNTGCYAGEAKLRPDYYSLSSEFDALTQMVNDQIGKMASSCVGSAGNFSAADSSDLFERGRFYDAYSARRNERLKRKKCETGDGDEMLKTPSYHLGVNFANSKKRDSKKLESLKKSVSAAYSVDRTQNSRYMLRSLSKDKENKKPGSSMTANKFGIGTPSVSGAPKMTARRGRRI